jgi:hypothetical protein
MSNRQSSAMEKLKRQPRGFAFSDPSIPLKSRKWNFVKPTEQMLRLAREAVAAGRVRYIPMKQKRKPNIWEEPVELDGFTVTRS